MKRWWIFCYSKEVGGDRRNDFSQSIEYSVLFGIIVLNRFVGIYKEKVHGEQLTLDLMLWKFNEAIPYA